MNAFYEHHKNHIRSHYACFDRILLNGLIQPFQQPERVIGFFNSYRNQFPVSRKVLTDIADQFHGWVKNRSEKWNAPIIEAPLRGEETSSWDPTSAGRSRIRLSLSLKPASQHGPWSPSATTRKIAGICKWPAVGR